LGARRSPLAARRAPRRAAAFLPGLSRDLDGFDSAVILAAIERHLPGFEPAGASAGLHVTAWLPPGLMDAPLVESQ
jgi:hypothetical protein